MSTDTPNHGFSSPFIRPDGMMMSEILAMLDDVEMTPTQRRDLKSAVRTICKLIDRPLNEVPANISWVEVRMRRIHPAQIGLSEKRLKNIRSGVLKALELCGASRVRSDWQSTPSPEWSALLAMINGQHDGWRLARLAQYCTAVQVPPHKVSDREVRGLLEALQTETFIANPEVKVREAVNTWNRMKRTIPAWPQIELSPLRKKEPWTYPLDLFPQSFQDDVDRWIDRLGNPDPFTDEGPTRSLRPATLEYHRFAIRQLASAILLSSKAPIGEAKDLRWMVDFDRLKNGLRFMMQRLGGTPTEAIQKLAVTAKAISEHHVKVELAHLSALKALCGRLKGGAKGLRAKNQARLSQLDDDRNLARLLHLPQHLLDRTRRQTAHPYRQALLVQAALAIEILLHAPMRIGNLSRLNLDRHIRRSRVKGQDCLLLSIPGAEVKNRRDLSFELTGDTLALFDLYMKLAFGKAINPHLFRDCAATFAALEDPEHVGIVSPLLGHVDHRTSEAHYIQANQISAGRRLRRSVATLRDQLFDHKGGMNK